MGCRILIRLLEHAPCGTMQLMEEVLASAGDLIRHDFGHYVIEAMLEHGLDMQKRAIYWALEQEFARNVRGTRRFLQQQSNLCPRLRPHASDLA